VRSPGGGERTEARAAPGPRHAFLADAGTEAGMERREQGVEAMFRKDA